MRKLINIFQKYVAFNLKYEIIFVPHNKYVYALPKKKMFEDSKDNKRISIHSKLRLTHSDDHLQ